MWTEKYGKLLTSESVGTGPSSYKKRIYLAAISQRLRNAVVDGVYCRGSYDLWTATWLKVTWKYVFSNEICEHPKSCIWHGIRLRRTVLQPTLRLSSSVICLLHGSTLWWTVPCQRETHGLDTNTDCGDIGRYSETDVVRSTERSPVLKRGCLLHSGWCCVSLCGAAAVRWFRLKPHTFQVRHDLSVRV